RAIQNQTIVNSRAVGVLLPMTGKYQKIAEQTLHGIELAFRFYNPTLPNSKITLMIEDSGETPEEAIRALDKLFFEDHVVAVFGPLLSRGIDHVTQRAQVLGLPMISL